VGIVLGTTALVIMVSVIGGLAEAVQKGLDGLGFDGVVFAVSRAATDRIEQKKQGYSRGMRAADGQVIESGRETIDQAAPVLGQKIKKDVFGEEEALGREILVRAPRPSLPARLSHPAH
jgi:hypothetical protein